MSDAKPIEEGERLMLALIDDAAKRTAEAEQKVHDQRQAAQMAIDICNQMEERATIAERQRDELAAALHLAEKIIERAAVAISKNNLSIAGQAIGAYVLSDRDPAAILALRDAALIERVRAAILHECDLAADDRHTAVHALAGGPQ